MNNLVDILKDSGYIVLEGKDEVIKMIKSNSQVGCLPRCSGFRIFPDGRKCYGCRDCLEYRVESFLNE